MTKYISNLNSEPKGTANRVIGYVNIANPEREIEPMPKGNPDTLFFSDMFPNSIKKKINDCRIGKFKAEPCVEELDDLAKQIKGLLEMGVGVNKIALLVHRGRETVFKIMDRYDLWTSRKDHFAKLRANRLAKFEQVASLMSNGHTITSAMQITNMQQLSQNVDELKDWLLKEKGIDWNLCRRKTKSH
jgi:hypothetical protein